jgi:hypothetical protein
MATCRRCFYGRGIPRALLYQQQGLDMESPQDTTIDFSEARHVAGVPQYLFRTAATTAVAMLRATARRDWVAAFEHELWLCMFAGILRQRWRDRARPFEWPRRADVVTPSGGMRIDSVGATRA